MSGNELGEAARIARLKEFGVLDTLRDEVFDALARQALSIAPGATISAISLIDADRQWFKAIVGFDSVGTARSDSFCTHTIQQPNGLMIVEDAASDERFRDNPLVTAEPHIRSYAGVRLLDGVGALCVICDHPRKFTDAEVMNLRILAKYVDIQLMAYGLPQVSAKHASLRRHTAQ